MSKQRPKPVQKCQHCGKEVRIFRARELCYYCHKDPVIRAKYPPKATGGVYVPAHREPTLEELDAMIKDRMRNLPAWWDNSKAHDDLIKGD